jgi:NitT/TauT family transport system substrate-binding protein
MSQISNGTRRNGVIRWGFLGAILFATLPINSARAEDLKKVSVRMDWVFSGYHAPFFVGVKNGYYKAEGLDVTVEPGNGSGIVAQSVGNGNDTFAAVDGGTMMNLRSKGLRVKAIMGILQRSPLSIVYRESSDIQKPKDLEGKKIGVTNGEAPLILLPAFLKVTGVDASKVSLINADPASKEAILLAGQVDGVLNFNFLAVPPLEEHGLKVKTFNYADYGINVPGLSLIARNEFLDAEPDLARKFVRATVKAYEWTVAHPEEAIDILIAANPNEKIPKSSSLRILTLSFPLLHSETTKNKPLGVMAKEDWAKAEDLLVQYQGMKRVSSPDQYFTNAFVGK